MKKTDPDRPQVNVRLDDEMIRLVDAKRVALQQELGTIPTRSEVVRIALEKYLRPGVKRN